MSEYASSQEVELGRQLTDLGRQLRYPATPDLASAVSAHLRQGLPAGRSTSPFPHRRRLIYPVLAALAILGSVLALSPQARSAAASWFHLPGFEILSSGPVGRTEGSALHLGTWVSLQEAQRRVRFTIILPSLTGLRKPDEMYAGTPPLSANSVSLLYRARPGLPRASTTGAGLLITEFQRRYFDAKRLPLGSAPHIVWLNNQPGVWLAGAPHLLYFVDEKGHVIQDTRRLAGNVLVWRHGTVMLRMEGRLSLQHALVIARSIR